MTTIKESELESESHGDCTQCYENDGDIFLCGEGYICTECFAKFADVDEAEAFNEETITKENKDKIRGKIAGEQLSTTE